MLRRQVRNHTENKDDAVQIYIKTDENRLQLTSGGGVVSSLCGKKGRFFLSQTQSTWEGRGANAHQHLHVLDYWGKNHV